MEVYPAGLSADGMKQTHDQSSGVVGVGEWGSVRGGLFFSPGVLHTE